MSYNYKTNCVNSTAQLIGHMIEAAQEVSYRTFIRYVNWREVSQMLGYSTDSRHGLTLKHDYAVTYHKSTYDGAPCYFVVWSAIEYVWTPGGARTRPAS